LDDDEAYKIWHEKVGLPEERIVRMGKEDNFWEHGQGPCGPCSELYFDRGADKGCGREECAIGCDCDRFIEFWNLVFTQFDKDEEGNYKRLANPNIDTGMGLERIAAIMQEVDSIFDVDTMKNIRDGVCRAAGVEYGRDRKRDSSIRLITDHIRSVTFMVSDGILPSNEGRGYVLRRLLRRAARHGKLLGISGSFLYNLCDIVIDNNREAYPELEEKKEYIKKVIMVEEQRFDETIDQGLVILNTYIHEMKAAEKNILDGSRVFKLYDTYGFPAELTVEILEEQGISIDNDGFNNEMEAQKERARSAREETNFMGRDTDVFTRLPADLTTSFSGYGNTISEGKVLALIVGDEIANSADEGSEAAIILDNTSFYAEMGGQVGDQGVIEGIDFKIEVGDCRKTPNGKTIHIGRVVWGRVSTGSRVTTVVSLPRRLDICRNHTATHLLHAALRQILGSHVEQSGSLVDNDRLRFDFTHFEPITPEDLLKVERIINEKILESMTVETMETSLDEAKRMGATALFGEKYGSMVRIVKAGDFSMELCGGTHVNNTSAIGLLKIVSEGGVAAGVRRIEAVTGRGAFDYIESQDRLLKDTAAALKTTTRDILRRVDSLVLELKDKDREIDDLKAKVAAGASEDILRSAVDIKGIKAVTAIVDIDIEGLRSLGDRLRDKLGKSVIILASRKDGKITFIAMASKEAVASGVHAGNIIREVAKIAGGSGGGKPDMAQAGGKDPGKLTEALKSIHNIIESMIK
jgi:alanyl-tRNA synthetase